MIQDQSSLQAEKRGVDDVITRKVFFIIDLDWTIQVRIAVLGQRTEHCGKQEGAVSPHGRETEDFLCEVPEPTLDGLVDTSHPVSPDSITQL